MYTYVSYRLPQILSACVRCVTDSQQLSSTLAVDIIITVIIAWGLWKSKTGWRHTDKMIMRIIMYVTSHRAGEIHLVDANDIQVLMGITGFTDRICSHTANDIRPSA